MKQWKRIAALLLSVCTMGMTTLSTACGDKGGGSSIVSEETSSVKDHSHVWKVEVTQEPTCTETGLKKKNCTVCDEEEFEIIEINAENHSIVKHEAKAPTCTAIGWDAYETCENCDYTTQEILEVLEHNYIDGVCVNGCGEKKVCAHVWGEYEIIRAATCTEKGWKMRVCGECKEEEFDSIPAGHALVYTEGKAATCNVDGWTAGNYCKDCDYDETESISATGHKYVNNVCVNDGCESIQNFWANLAKNSVGGGNSGKVDYTGDVKINGDPSAAVAYDGSRVTVTFYHTMGQKLQEVLNRWIPEFNKQYPNITIEHMNQGGYPDLRNQIVTELNGGNSPSIAYCYPDHVALYNKSRAVATLDDFIASETMGLGQEVANEFVRGYYEEGRAYGDGKMYTLPYSKSTEVLYYNKTFFEEHDLRVPTTWDEMETVMQQIIEIDPNSIPLGYDSEANWFITMCEQLNTPYTTTTEGNKFAYDVTTNHEFVGRLREWYQNGLVITEEIYGAYTSDLFIQTDPMQAKSYMCIGSTAGASYQCPDPFTDENGQVVYPFEVGVAMIPQIDAENPKVISQGPSLCMFNKTNKQEMAATWLFMKFLTTNLGLQAEFSATSGYAPVIKNLDKKHEGYADFLATADGNAWLQATCIKQCLTQENAMFVIPAFVGSSVAREEVGILIQNCFVNSPANGQSAADFIKEQFKASVDKLKYEYGA